MALEYVFIGLIILLVIAIIALIIAGFVFWIMMIIDVSRRNFKESSEKAIWVLLIVLTGLIGATIYYFVVKKAKKKK